MMTTTTPTTTTPTTTTPTTTPTAEAIELLTPVEAGLQLQLSADALLDVVNRGLLPAYDLGGHIRFRATDVAAALEATAA